MTRLLLDSSAYIAFKKRTVEVIETIPKSKKYRTRFWLFLLETPFREK
jgi:hypothetical protein